MMRMRAGVLIFQDVEVLDFCGPFEVLSVTRTEEGARHETVSPFLPCLIAQTMEPVHTTGGMVVVPHHSFETTPRLDLLIVPGGWGTRREVHNRSLIDWIAARAEEATWVASVCTGSFLLAEAGLLDGKRATTHHASLDRFEQTYPSVRVERGVRVVDEGRILTSAGIAAGIDMTLLLVERILGEPVAAATAAHMEYPRIR